MKENAMTTSINNQVTHLSEQDFDKFLSASDRPVLVDFWAPWCGPCRVLGPIMEGVAQAHGDKVRVVKVNVDENQTLAQRFGIRGIPTVVVFKDGEAVGSVSGAHPRPFWDEVVAKVA
jgi:thioredoxin 1